MNSFKDCCSPEVSGNPFLNFVLNGGLPRWTSKIQILTTVRLLRFEFLVRLASHPFYIKILLRIINGI